MGERGFCWEIFIVAPQIQVFTGFSPISITFFPCHIEFDFLFLLNYISTLVFLFLFIAFIKKMVYLGGKEGMAIGQREPIVFSTS